MEGQEKQVREELIKLIKESCSFEVIPKLEYQKFHSSFLKYTFSARHVEIDYEKKIISIWNCKPSPGTAMEFYAMDALVETMGYSDLEETLLGCIEDGIFNERFYHHLLYDLDRVYKDTGNRAG